MVSRARSHTRSHTRSLALHSLRGAPDRLALSPPVLLMHAAHASAAGSATPHRYRAPEILAGSSTYKFAVDIWSLGCIFGEMLGGKPVFPGTSTLDQLEKIGDCIGPPNSQDVEAMASRFTLEMLDQMTYPTGPLGDESRGKKPFNKNSVPSPEDSFDAEPSWRHLYPPPKADDQAIDLLCKIMKYHPDKRMSARDGLNHPYCAQFHDEGARGPTHRSGGSYCRGRVLLPAGRACHSSPHTHTPAPPASWLLRSDGARVRSTIERVGAGDSTRGD